MSITGTYRTGGLEQSAMVMMRRKGFSINQVADVFKRSTRTVHKYAGAVAIDNRRQSPLRREFNAATFRGRVMELRTRMRLFLSGLCSFTDAMGVRALPLGLIAMYLETGKNSEGEEDTEPA